MTVFPLRAGPVIRAAGEIFSLDDCDSIPVRVSGIHFAAIRAAGPPLFAEELRTNACIPFRREFALLHALMVRRGAILPAPTWTTVSMAEVTKSKATPSIPDSPFAEKLDSDLHREEHWL